MNYSHSLIPPVGEKSIHYTSHEVMRADGSRQLQNITNQPVKLILYAVDNNILQNTPIIWEDVGMTEEIYGTSVPNLQGKTLHDKVQHLEPIILPNLPKVILDI